MPIRTADLTPADVGRWVIYESTHAPPERGRIKSWNEHVVFVVYRCNEEWERFADFTGEATFASALRFETA